ncbi:hypothetical protein GCM10022225_37610 [Plantactinospora mayteni]|uniref:Uncharacterized protein n=1 Tax=Plantactinospora mayteni TaxID=566021 RepID=A0ABQ4EM51_9ACTN|nr:hypothetical protein Pma05_19140 [Plantactinospora mayteni]
MARCGRLRSRISVERLPVAIGRPFPRSAARGPPASALTCADPSHAALSKQSYHGGTVRFPASPRWATRARRHPVR